MPFRKSVEKIRRHRSDSPQRQAKRIAKDTRRLSKETDKLVEARMERIQAAMEKFDRKMEMMDDSSYEDSSYVKL